jgi:hypothetical protein
MGCLMHIVTFALVAYALRPWTLPYEAAGWGPWPGLLAAGFLTLATSTLWELLKRLAQDGDPRADMLARAERGELPQTDGPVVASGRLRAASGTLKAPLSGVDCVAYVYRMFIETNSPENFRDSQPVYWGYASRPFTLDTQTRALRVMAVPQLEDAAQRLDSAEDRERARHYASTTAFEETFEALGMLGVVGTVLSVAGTLYSDEDGEVRRDWKLGGASANLDTLLLEETVLPVGAQVTLTGTWSVARNAVLSSAQGPLRVSTGTFDAVRPGSLPVGNLGTVIWLLAFAAAGAGILWGAKLV